MKITANDPNRISWLSVAEDSHFPIQNIPFGVFITKDDIKAVEQIELKRIINQKEKNKEYLPIMEAMYKSIGKLNDMVNSMEQNILNFV